MGGETHALERRREGLVACRTPERRDDFRSGVRGHRRMACRSVGAGDHARRTCAAPRSQGRRRRRQGTNRPFVPGGTCRLPRCRYGMVGWGRGAMDRSQQCEGGFAARDTQRRLLTSPTATLRAHVRIHQYCGATSPTGSPPRTGRAGSHEKKRSPSHRTYEERGEETQADEEGERGKVLKGKQLKERDRQRGISSLFE